MTREAEGTRDALTFDEELLLWLGDEPPGVRAADAERIRDIAGEFARGFDALAQVSKPTASNIREGVVSKKP